MKFKYTNSNNEEAMFDALPLTSELYSDLLEVDKEFLFNVSEGKEVFFSEQKYIEAAQSMLTSFGKARESTVPESKPSDGNVVLYIQNKTLLKEGDSIKNRSNTPKQELRTKLVTSQIRSFKKEKMELNFEMA